MEKGREAQKERAPLEVLWERLSCLSPEEVARRAQVVYIPGEETYRVPLLKEMYRVRASRREIERIQPSSAEKEGPGFLEVGAILNYLLHAQDVPLAGKWLGGTDLPGGVLFFTPAVHALFPPSLLERFGECPDEFRRLGLALGGEEEDYGDVAIRFSVFPRVPILHVLWVGDEEFPPRGSVLFDENAGRQFPLDMLLALASIIARRLLGK